MPPAHPPTNDWHRPLLAILLFAALFAAILFINLRHQPQTTKPAQAPITETAQSPAAAKSEPVPRVHIQPLNTKTLPPNTDIITADAMINAMYKPASSQPTTTPTSSAELMSTAWLLVLKNYTSPKQYLSSKDPIGPATQPAPNDLYAWRNDPLHTEHAAPKPTLEEKKALQLLAPTTLPTPGVKRAE